DESFRHASSMPRMRQAPPPGAGAASPRGRRRPLEAVRVGERSAVGVDEQAVRTRSRGIDVDRLRERTPLVEAETDAARGQREVDVAAEALRDRQTACGVELLA